MNTTEARQLIIQILVKYRCMAYSELVVLIDKEEDTGEIISPSGVKYQYEIQVFWDNTSNGNVRVMGAIDNYGLRAFAPLSFSFIKTPTGDFIGE
jgi:membrane-bound inhibitor of C-type lysozyme